MRIVTGPYGDPRGSFFLFAEKICVGKIRYNHGGVSAIIKM